MAASESEERIRAKVEAFLRAEFPDARIVHELKMAEGLVRLDMAAVRPSAITIVEIKSERDVLKRLKSQVVAALRITGDVRVYAAEKHATQLNHMSSPYAKDENGRTKTIRTERPKGGWHERYVENPDHLQALGDVLVMIEAEDSFRRFNEMHSSWWPRKVMEHMAEPRRLLELLWAEELRTLCSNGAIGVSARAPRGVTMRLALDYLTGSQVRMGVCAALRSRPFARADEIAA